MSDEKLTPEEPGEGNLAIWFNEMEPAEMEKFLAVLSAEERQVLRLGLGLDDGLTRTNEEIAELLRISVDSVAAVLSAGCQKLADYNRQSGPQGPRRK